MKLQYVLFSLASLVFIYMQDLHQENKFIEV